MDNSNDNPNDNCRLSPISPEVLKNMSGKDLKKNLNIILANNDIENLRIFIDNGYISLKSVVLHGIVNNNCILILALMDLYNDIDKINQSNDSQYNGLSLLDIACQYGNLNMVKLLSENTGLITRINQASGQLTLLTPLHVAIASNELEITSYLLDHYPNLAKINSDKTGNNIVHLSVDIGNLNILELVLQKVDTDIINHKNNRGYTPLHLAVLENDLDAVKLLTQYNANLRIMDKTSRTPHELASSEGYNAIVSYLEERQYTDNYESVSLF